MDKIYKYEYIAGQKGKNKLFADGFFYIQEKKTDDTTYWKCEQYKKKCKSRVIDKLGDLRLKQTHNHEGNPEKFEVTKMMNTIKQQARASKDPPRLLLSRASTSFSKGASTSCSSLSNISRTIRQVRSLEHVGTSIPKCLEDVIVTEKYQKTDKGEQFLLFDSKDKDRILMFATRRNLDFPIKSQEWFMDGTFKIVPKLFYQLFTIHGNINGAYYPLIYSLLPDKRESTYVKIFEHIRKIMEKIEVNLIMTDFEKAVINACQLLFPKAIKQGCYFHYRQCIYRRIQLVGMKTQYDSDPDFQHKIKLFIALAFVPVEYVTNAFDILLDNEDLCYTDIKPLIEYFEQTWIGKMERKERRPPMYEHSLWNFYERTIHGQQRTNNVVEGWHSSMGKTFQAKEPSVWAFIDGLVKEQSLQEMKINQELAGYNEQNNNKKKYKDKNARLRTVVSRFADNFEDSAQYIFNYLEQVAYNI
jgi:hypothetical protein